MHHELSDEEHENTTGLLANNVGALYALCDRINVKQAETIKSSKVSSRLLAFSTKTFHLWTR